MDLQDALSAFRLPGAVVLYPTETVYGLGSRISDSVGIQRIHTLKKAEARAQIVLVEGVPSWLSGLAREMAEEFWPGPLTLVVEPPEGFALEARASDSSLAIRWSSHPVVRRLVSELGPITSTSANVHGQSPIRVPADLVFEVDAIVDVGCLPVCRASTLVDTRSGVVLREGAVFDEVSSWMGTRGTERL